MSKEAFLAGIMLPAMAVLTGCAQQKMQRYGSVIEIKKDAIEEYKQLHANPWPEVVKKIKECNIRNYSIYLGKIEEDRYYLFGYFEYIGKDFKADMAKMAADKTTQKWWKHTNPTQIPIPGRAEGDWWMTMEEVFHAE